MSKERRTRTRVPAGGPCTIKDETGAERAFELIDLSECGARLRCETAIGAMTSIQVSMQLPAERIGQSEDGVLNTTGVVVWSHRSDDGTFDTGVFFPDLEDRTSDQLFAYVASADGDIDSGV
jgi:hypothetical protein